MCILHKIVLIISFVAEQLHLLLPIIMDMSLPKTNVEELIKLYFIKKKPGVNMELKSGEQCVCTIYRPLLNIYESISWLKR